jgi:hypothetical protein
MRLYLEQAHYNGTCHGTHNDLVLRLPEAAKPTGGLAQVHASLPGAGAQ